MSPLDDFAFVLRTNKEAGERVPSPGVELYGGAVVGFLNKRRIPMKKSIHLIILAACAFTLSACGAYVGSPPKTEIHESTTTQQPPDEVHVYTR
jgi:hypothetical protein